MHDVFMQATGAAPKPKLSAKEVAGRKGGLVGGKKRMDSMTDEEKAKLSAMAVAARKKAPAIQTGASARVKRWVSGIDLTGLDSCGNARTRSPTC